MDSNPIRHPSPAKKNKMLFFGLHSTSDDWPGWSMDLNTIRHPSPAKKIKCLFLDYVSTFDDRPGWSIDSNPICHPSPAKKMKCSFSDYVQLLMNGQWTQTPFATPLQQKKWNAHFRITFNFWWSVNALQPHLPPLSSKKLKCLFLDYVQLLMIGQAGWWTQTPSATPLQPKI